MTKKLLTALFVLIVAGLLYWLGTLLLAAIHAPIIFLTIWMIVVILIVVVYLYRLIVGDSNILP